MERMFSMIRSDSDACQATEQGFESPSGRDSSDNAEKTLSQYGSCSDQMKYQWHSWFQPVDTLQHDSGKKDETPFSPCTEDENDVHGLEDELNDSDCQVWSECLATIESIKTFINNRRHGYFDLMLSVSSWEKNYESNPSNDQYNQEEVIRRTRDLIRLTKKKELMKKDVIPCIFYWPYEAQTVYLSGSFLAHHFEKKLRMIRSSDRFVAVFELPKGTYRYKFLVDGQWRVLPNEPIHQSSDGSTSNILDISCNKQQSFNVLFDYEKARTQKYQNIPPDPCTYTSQAPNIPLLLRKSKTILFNGSRHNTTILHSLCNHMYLNVDSSRDFGEGILCTSVTCRSRRTSKSILSSVGPRFTTLVYITAHKQGITFEGRATYTTPLSFVDLTLRNCINFPTTCSTQLKSHGNHTLADKKQLISPC